MMAGLSHFGGVACCFFKQTYRRPFPGTLPRYVSHSSTGKKKKLSSQRWLNRHLRDPFVKQAQKEGYRSRAALKLQQLDDKFKFLSPGSRVVDLGAAPGGWTQVAVERVRADLAIASIEAVPAGRKDDIEEAYDLEADTIEMHKQLYISAQREQQELQQQDMAEEASTQPPATVVKRKVNSGKGGVGVVVGVDLLEYDMVGGSTGLVGDFRRRAVRRRVAQLTQGRVDVVMCDMAPEFSGIPSLDHGRQLSLARLALLFALHCLPRPTTTGVELPPPSSRQGGAGKRGVAKGKGKTAGGVFVTKVFEGAETPAFRLLLGKLFSEVKVLKPGASRKESSELFYFCRGLKNNN